MWLIESIITLDNSKMTLKSYKLFWNNHVKKIEIKNI